MEREGGIGGGEGEISGEGWVGEGERDGWEREGWDGEGGRVGWGREGGLGGGGRRVGWEGGNSR